MTKTVFDALKKGSGSSSQKKRSSQGQASSAHKHQKVSSGSGGNSNALAHLLVVGDSPVVNSQAPATNSVFSVLTANAAKAFQTHHFFCGIQPDGVFFTDMWAAGQARPEHATTQRWNTVVKVKMKASPGDAGDPGVAQDVDIKLSTSVVSDATQAHTPDGIALKTALTHNTPPPGYEKYSGGAPLLKSALQKSVRRCRPKEAGKLAFALLELSPADALRRAAVMSLEDACLHPLLPAMVWMMMAQGKGYKLNFDQKALVVRFYKELAGSRVKEAAVFDGFTPEPLEETKQVKEAAANGGCHEGQESGCSGHENATSNHINLQTINSAIRDTSERALVSSMLLRASYGGMACDVALLQSACSCWLQRFQAAEKQQTTALSNSPNSSQAAALKVHTGHADGNASVQHHDNSHEKDSKASRWQKLWTALFSNKPETTAWGGIHMLRASDIPLAAVDGHVTQGVVSALLADDTILTGLEELGCQEEYAGDDPQQILSQLMWEYRSGVSFKVPAKCKLLECAKTLETIPSTLKPQDLGTLEQRVCTVADSWSGRFIQRCFSRS